MELWASQAFKRSTCMLLIDCLGCVYSCILYRTLQQRPTKTLDGPKESTEFHSVVLTLVGKCSYYYWCLQLNYNYKFTTENSHEQIKSCNCIDRKRGGCAFRRWFGNRSLHSIFLWWVENCFQVVGILCKASAHDFCKRDSHTLACFREYTQIHFLCNVFYGGNTFVDTRNVFGNVANIMDTFVLPH